jgi:hypothetical protein
MSRRTAKAAVRTEFKRQYRQADSDEILAASIAQCAAEALRRGLLS